MTSEAQTKTKLKLVLGFISQDLATSLKLLAEDVGMQLECFSYNNVDEFVRAARTADAVFLQWDGRANTSHDLLTQWSQRPNGPRGVLYVVTTSKIRLDPLPSKVIKQLNIAGWYDIPEDASKLKTELSILVPDPFNDPAAELQASGLDKVFDTPLLRLRGRHLVGEITSAWNERSTAQQNFMRVRDEIQRPHLTFFAADQGVGSELKQFLVDAKYKNFEVFHDADDALKFMRGHSTDALICWYDHASRATEDLLQSRLESRSSKAIPIVLLYTDQTVVKVFQDRCPRLHVDIFFHFDRSRENFRFALLSAFQKSRSPLNPLQILDELRAPPRDHPNATKSSASEISKSCPPTASELDILCDRLAAEPGKAYWADAERLLGYARLKEAQKFESMLMIFSSRYSHFDAQLVIAISRSQIFREEAPSAAHGLTIKINGLPALNSDRLFRAGTFFSRSESMQALKSLLDYWWNNQDRHMIDHQFFFLASRYAYLGGYKSLERSLLGMALRGDPLRSDYVEAYAHHLYITDHPGHVVMLCEFLAFSKYFPFRKGQTLLLNAHMKLRNHRAALTLIQTMLKDTPDDKALLALEKKCLAFPT